MKPIIGISGNWAPYRKGRPDCPDSTFSYVQDTYLEAVIDAGGIPYIIPVVEDEESVRDMLSVIDGLLLTGGGDIDPSFWDADHRSDKLCYVKPRRDIFDIALFTNAALPILAICRGHQLISIAIDGDLYQDLEEFPVPTLEHKKLPTGELPLHKVTIEKDSLLAKVLGTTEYIANSAHHQIVKVVPSNFRAVAWSMDGAVEAMEGKWNSHDVISVQWHAELMEDQPEHNLFFWLVEEANRSKGKK